MFKRSYVWQHTGYAQWLNKIDMMRLVHDYRQESPDPNKMWAPPGKIRNEQGQFVDAPVLSAKEEADKQAQALAAQAGGKGKGKGKDTPGGKGPSAPPPPTKAAKEEQERQRILSKPVRSLILTM